MKELRLKQDSLMWFWKAIEIESSVANPDYVLSKSLFSFKRNILGYQVSLLVKVEKASCNGKLCFIQTGKLTEYLVNYLHSNETVSYFKHANTSILF